MVLLLISTFSFAQINSETKRANHWYFGQGAGIDWTSGSPVAVTDGQTNTYEGAASISDLNGNLLFYSDGNTIWNKNHVPMQGGYNLLGCDGIPTPIQVTQNALIITHPGNDSLYYLFHLGCLDFELYTLKYTVVNMNMNGGLGGVASANNPIMATNSQSLAACRHTDGCSVWITAIDTNNYYNFFKFSATGLDINNPVQQFMEINYDYPQGYSSNTVFSCDLTMMANISMTGIQYDTLIIYQFDNLTATISDPIKIFTGDQTVSDLCFSPDNSKLYASASEGNAFSLIDTLWQFDLSNYTEAAVLSSKIVIYADSMGIGNFQNGLDGKIYMVRSNFHVQNANYDSLAVINNPNSAGSTCNFSFNAIYLNGKISISSLPNFEQGYFYPLLNNTCAIGVNEITLNDFRVYPNPAAEYFTLENTQGFEFDMILIDINGKINSIGNLQAYENKKINISFLSNGMYLLQLKNNNTIINYKLIKN